MGYKDDVASWIIFIFFIAVLMGIALEIFIIGVGFIYADEVECNLFWCTFKSSKTLSLDDRHCFMDGEPINCSELDLMKDSWGVVS